MDFFSPEAQSTNLLVHVVEQFTTSIFGDNSLIGGLKWIHQMPMPVMQIDANIFAEVPQSVRKS